MALQQQQQQQPAEGNIFAYIGNGYYHFTAAERKVADYVLNHSTEVQYMSISDLAEECGVAEATVSRFCRQLKLKGYNAFKLALAKATVAEQGSVAPVLEGQEGNIGPEDSLSELCRKIYAAQTAAIGQSMSLIRPEAVNRAVELLWTAERVYCMGQGGSLILSWQAAHLFSTVSPKFHFSQDSHLQATTAALLTERDAILFFSYSGSTKDITELMGLAKKRGASIILVTRFSKSPGAARADVVLQCGSFESPLQLSSIPAEMAQLYVVDVLYNEFIRRDPETARRNQERIAEALAEKHI
ncbi:MAG: MurR/RpiR family transcriptional regulator [Clostridiales bacterium]|nr:MurR/RpiR family transcriptional regulator [Clostridiales bacterium]